MRETRLEIDRKAILHNLNVFKKLINSDTRILVNLKGNAYGMGAVELGKLFEKQAVDYFSVAYINEGIELRNAGIQTKILVFNPSPEHFDTLISYRLEPEISSLLYLKKILHYAHVNHWQQFPVHLKLDTGMHRAGITSEELSEAINLITKQNRLTVKSVFSHLAAAEDPNEDSFTRGQIDMFEQMTRYLQQHIPPFFRHLLNTAGIFRFNEAQYDMIRPGLGIFGYNLVKNRQDRLKPVARLITRINQTKKIPRGETVGYNRNFTATTETTRVALLPLGYADGINRLLGQGNWQVTCRGKRLPIIGNISMDTMSIDISGTDCRAGDQVIVFDNCNDVYQMAAQLQTIPYEIITAISRRVFRVLV